MLLFFLMVWIFPLQWSKSLCLYVVASVMCFAGLSIAFEDFGWARRVLDMFQPRIQPVGQAPTMIG
jgi:hypothetical protein